jgi:spermidine synthase
MTRNLASLLLGACLVTTAYAAQRLIAPYAGLSLTLYTAVALATLLGFALGCALGASPARTAATGGVVAARALLVAAALALAVPVVRRPLLEALHGLDLRIALVLAAIKFTGVPAAALGFAFAARQAGSDATGVLRSSAALIAGAALAVPLAGWVLAPHLGLTLTFILVGATEAVVGAWLGMRRAPLVTSAGTIALLAASVVLATRPATAARIGPRMVELRTGHETELRVFDRDGARYLMADGTIHAVIDTLTWDCIQRGPAALDLLQLMRPGRDSMVVFGLRGGALPLQFARSGWRVTVVEPDTDAVAVSRRVSYKPGELRLEPLDARTWLRQDTGRHSVMVVDAFADSWLPYTLCTREFVAGLADHLLDDGVVVMVVETRGWKDPLLGALSATLHTRFDHVLALPTSEPPNAVGTVLLYASRHAPTFTDDDLPDPRDYFQNPAALWAEQQLSHAWLNRFEPDRSGAAVLTDDRNGRVDVWGDGLNRASRAELHAYFGPHGGSW